MLRRSPYAELPASALAAALAGESAEGRALVAESAGEMKGLVVFGMVAGAIGTGRVHLVAVPAAERLRGVGGALLVAAMERFRDDDVRVVFVEMPDDPSHAPTRSLLLREGFVEEARVADFFRDGVSLVLLRRDVA